VGTSVVAVVVAAVVVVANVVLQVLRQCPQITVPEQQTLVGCCLADQAHLSTAQVPRPAVMLWSSLIARYISSVATLCFCLPRMTGDNTSEQEFLRLVVCPVALDLFVSET
jgi:hypothetical protein